MFRYFPLFFFILNPAYSLVRAWIQFLLSWVLFIQTAEDSIILVSECWSPMNATIRNERSVESLECDMVWVKKDMVALKWWKKWNKKWWSWSRMDCRQYSGEIWVDVSTNNRKPWRDADWSLPKWAQGRYSSRVKGDQGPNAGKSDGCSRNTEETNLVLEK